MRQPRFALRPRHGIVLVALVPACAGAGPEKLAAQPPEPILHPGGSAWTAGTQAFREATSAWGLDALGVEGVRLSAVDYDGDGFADLFVRFGGNAADDFKAGGRRTTWLLRNDHHGRFEDVTAKSGLRRRRSGEDPDTGRAGEVFAFGDVDNDGDLDVITGLTTDAAHPSGDTTELLLNDGHGAFELGPEDNPFRRQPDAVAGISFVDFDRDGNLDLWIVENSIEGQPQQDRLYRGDGRGRFTDVTGECGLTTKAWDAAEVEEVNGALGHSNGWSANACDLDNDGSPELLASSYGRAPNHLWLAKGGAGALVYENRSVASGYAFDANQDWSDNESARCWCTLHPGDEGCEGVPAPAHIRCASDTDAFRWNHARDRNAFRLGGNSGATMCADVDNDGWMDLVTSEIVHWDVGGSSDRSELLLNARSPEVLMIRPGNEATGLARSYASFAWNEGIMTGSVFDFDNDGWADLYFGNSDYPGARGLLFRQDAPAHFVAVPPAQGIDQHRSHGSAVADFDHDGDLDLVVGHSFSRRGADPKDDAPCYATQQVRMFENVLGQRGNFVAVTLVGGAGTNRAAIGARVSVTAGNVTQTKDVEGGHGHYGAQDDLTLLFGLGDAREAELEVRWPNRELTTQRARLPAGHRFLLEQGKAPIVDPRR